MYVFFFKSFTIKSQIVFSCTRRIFFLDLSQAPCSGRRGSVGLSLIRASGGLEIGEQFVHMCACPSQSTCVYVGEGWGMGGGGGGCTY